MRAASPPGGTARVCPLLVGRDDELAFAVRRRDEAAAGHGGLLLLGGEAGIGKSRLLDELTTRAGGRVVRAEAFAGDRDTPGLLLVGLAAGFRAAGDDATAERLHELVAEAVSATTSDSARRRLLVAELADALARALATPFLVRLEDLHWADQLSLDALRRAAAALDRLPSLVIATHRTDDPAADAAFTSWRLELLTQRQAEELLLTRLGREGTRSMLASITGAQPSEEDVDRLYAAADGIPLHVEELVAVGVDTVPDTVGDAVVARTASLDPDARAAIAAAAVIGREFDAETLSAVVAGEDGTPADVEAALDELARLPVVVPAGSGYDFRHALIRDAVYADLPAPQRRMLHARVVDAVPGLSDAVRSAHLERAGRADQAYRAARTAAQRASALSAHREAVGLYRRAERTVPSGTPVAERAELHRLLGSELAASDANEDAEREFARAVELFREARDEVEAAAVVPALVAARHLLGADYASRAATLEDALGRLDPDSGGPGALARGSLLAALAAAAMLDRRLDESLAFATAARPLLEGDVAERLAVDVTRGAVLVFAGRGDEGWDLLDSSAREAATLGLEATAARAYRMVGSSASVLLAYDRGMRWLQEGIAYATRIERWNDAHYLQAHLAHVEWATGQLASAWTRAERARADGRGGITTEVTALHVLGYVALARGELTTAHELLAEAAAIGERMRELQRLSPALWGLAEVALARGEVAAAAAVAERGYRESARIADAAYLFPFLVTGARARLAAGDITRAREWVERAGALVRERGIPGTEHAVAHAQGLVALSERGISRAKELLGSASAGWDALGRWWEGTQALLDLAECARRSRGPAEAAALVAEARRRAEASGAGAMLSRVAALEARLAEGAETSVLSAREREVATLVATGATNREIGDALHISSRTVATHIEHILAKLGATRRSEIAAWSAGERVGGRQDV